MYMMFEDGLHLLNFTFNVLQLLIHINQQFILFPLLTAVFAVTLFCVVLCLLFAVGFVSGVIRFTAW
jgi:hypothetical protein